MFTFTTSSVIRHIVTHHRENNQSVTVVRADLQEEAMLDDVIDRLLEVRAGRPGKQVQLTEQEIRQLCLTAKEIFMSQPNLLELEAPIKICGTSRLFFALFQPLMKFLSLV